MTKLDRNLLHGATLSVGVTGLAYAAFKHLMANEDPFSAVNHPLQPWALSLHILAAPVLVFVTGLVFKDHVMAKYRNGTPPRAKGSGVFVLAVILPAILTGYLLPVLADDTPRRLTAWLHLGFGALLLLAYGAHLLLVPKTSIVNGAAIEPGRGAVATGIRIGRAGPAASGHPPNASGRGIPGLGMAPPIDSINDTQRSRC